MSHASVAKDTNVAETEWTIAMAPMIVTRIPAARDQPQFDRRVFISSADRFMSVADMSLTPCPSPSAPAGQTPLDSMNGLGKKKFEFLPSVLHNVRIYTGQEGAPPKRPTIPSNVAQAHLLVRHKPKQLFIGAVICTFNSKVRRGK
jgi:hypothetical protein